MSTAVESSLVIVLDTSDSKSEISAKTSKADMISWTQPHFYGRIMVRITSPLRVFVSLFRLLSYSTTPRIQLRQLSPTLHFGLLPTDRLYCTIEIFSVLLLSYLQATVRAGRAPTVSNIMATSDVIFYTAKYARRLSSCQLCG